MSWLNQPYQGGYGQQPPPQGYQPGLQPQPTGYPQPLQGQRTGYPQQQQQQFQQPQQTGFLGGGLRPQLPLQGQPTGYAPMQRPMATGFPHQASFQQPQPTGFSPQPTGQQFGGPGAPGGGLQGPPIGSQFLSTFMPAANSHPSPYMDPAQMQFAANPAAGSLQQSFQQQNQAQTGQATVPIPWALTPDEKKRYDQIFRAWDQQGTGFIEGRVSQEVFGQAGLEQNDLMAIWNLADVQDRGKLNIDEFHVAMGLIYRRLNGNPIPPTLPAEMAPPSARDLDDSVGFLTSLLKNDTNQRSTNQEDGRGSMAKARSLHSPAPQANRKDATVFRNNDDASVYKSSARHIKREDVPSRGGSTDDDLDAVKRRLNQTESAFDRSRDKDDEEEELKDELRRMTRRIERVNDDLEYNERSGRRTTAKDDERRQLERELLKLKHEELPELERRIEEKKRDKRRDQQKYSIERDARNDKYDKYADRDRDRYSERRSGGGGSGYNSDSRRDRDESPERGYQRGTYDGGRGSSRDRSRYAPSPPRRSSPPPRARTPPPPPPPAPVAKAAPPPPPAVPAPSASPAVDTRNMTPAERQAHIRAEAQRRIQDRLRALGVAAPSSGDAAPAVDTSVADRLEQEKVAAARKAAEADEQIKAKELERQAKLEREKLRGVAIEQSINHDNAAAVEQVREEVKAAHPAAPVAQAATQQLDAEEEALAQREAALSKAKADRLARIAKLEEEAREAEAREAEENLARSRAVFAPKAAKVPPPPPTSRARPPPPQSRARPASASANDDDFTPPPPPVPAVVSPVRSPPTLSPPVAADPAQSPGESKNPFHRLQGNATSPAVTSPSAGSATNGKPNPFFAATPPAAPTPPPAPAAPPVRQPSNPAPVSKPAYRPPPPVDDDDWDAGGLEKDADESDSDDDNVGSGRQAQANLAANLFRGLGLGPARPSSAQGSTPPSRFITSSPAIGGGSAPPPPPPPPPPPAAPSAPAAPAAPRAPVAVAPAAPEARSALLGAIQGGLRLRKTETKDKSGPSVTGAVIGDASPPVQVYHAPSPPPSPPPPPPAPPAPEPVAAYEELAQASYEAPEEETTLPAIADEDPLKDIDLSTTIRVRSLFTYEGQRDEDLSFSENVVIVANPSKDSAGDWWYGKVQSSGQSGFIPRAYIEEINAEPAKALYSYEAASGEEHSFEENSTLSIVEQTDATWWLAEKDGRIGLVPATYLELNSSEAAAPSTVPQTSETFPSVPPPVEAALSPAPLFANETIDSNDDDDDSDVESPQNSKEREAERLRVLQAAGLLIRDGSSPVKRRPTRRPAPSRPPRQAPPPLPSSTADEAPRSPVEPVVQSEEHEEGDEEERMEDAYDVYQRAMRELPSVPASYRYSLDASSLTSPSLSSGAHLSPPSSPAPSTAASTTASSSIKDTWHTTTSNFRSRIRGTTSATGDRPKPVVSSPLISAPTPTEGQRGSPSFGNSWTSLIDPSALENMPDRERKRQEAIFEFISTESAYVQSLQLIIEVFFTQLQSVLPLKATQVIFANIEDILMFNTIFLSELEDRQRVARLYIDTIGDIIKSHLKGLDVYRGYCVNQSNAARTLADLKTSDTSLRTLLDGSRVKGLELEHFLLEPMQRLTRYPLLINQILRYTEPDHPDQTTLGRALQIAEGTLNNVNEAVRTHENEEKLAYLSDTLEFSGVLDGRIDLTAPTRLLGPRKILREGKLAKAKSKRPLNCYLFNDLLVFTESVGSTSEIVYRYPIPLEECSIREHARDDLCFSVTHRGETITVRSPTARTTIAWTREIEQARRTSLAALQKRRGGA